MTAARPCPADLFELVLPCAPSVSGGGQIAHLVHRPNRTEDRVLGELWALALDGGNHRRLAAVEPDIRSSAGQPRSETLPYVTRCNPTIDADPSHRIMRLELATGGVASRVCELP